MNEKNSVPRRRFLAASAALSAPLILPNGILAKDGKAPNDRINIGIIGTGGMGRGNTRGFMRNDDCRVVAVCDVDQQQLMRGAEQVNKHYVNQDCKTYSDYRELLTRDDIDAVTVATPDHWHALCSVAAAEAKKDIYCQKPITHTFPEGQAIVAATKRNNVIFQVGSQQRSHAKFRRAAAIVANGHIGKVKHVQVGLPTGHQKPNGNATEQAPPAHADYDFWCGPSEKLPFVPARYHFHWRWHLAYGGGQLMDWLGHHNDIAHWGLGRDQSGPVEVRALDFQYPEDRRVYNSAWKYEVWSKYDDGTTSSIANHHERGCKWIGEDGWVSSPVGTSAPRILRGRTKLSTSAPRSSTTHRSTIATFSTAYALASRVSVPPKPGTARSPRGTWDYSARPSASEPSIGTPRMRKS